MLETKPDNAVSIIECDMKVKRSLGFAWQLIVNNPISVSVFTVIYVYRSPPPPPPIYQVDFAPPVGYQPPQPEKMNTDSAQDAAMDVCKHFIVCQKYT